MLLLIIILLLLFGGGGFYGYRSGWYGNAAPVNDGAVPIVLMILVILLVLAVIGHRGGYLTF
jgi:hypothetical protein